MTRLRLAVFAPTPDGGHPVYVASLLSALANHTGPRLDIIWPVRADAVPVSVPTAVSRPVAITSMETAGSGCTLNFLRRLNLLRRHDLSFIRWLMCQKPFDAVLIEEHQRFALPLLVSAARLKARRVVVQLHNVRRHGYRGTLLDRFEERVMALGLWRADAVVVHAEENKKLLSERLSSRKISLVRHGLTPKRTSASAPAGHPVILFYGVNRPNKGLDVLIEAMKLLPSNFHLVIAGVTPEDHRATTERLVKQVQSVTWLDGFVDDTTTEQLMDAATIVVLPYTQFEAQSGVLHQAAEYLVPVVGTGLGGISETVTRYGNGILVPPGDASALANAIAEAASPERNTALRAGARRLQRGSTWNDAARELQDALFEETADDPE